MIITNVIRSNSLSIYYVIMDGGSLFLLNTTKAFPLHAILSDSDVWLVLLIVAIHFHLVLS